MGLSSSPARDQSHKFVLVLVSPRCICLFFFFVLFISMQIATSKLFIFILIPTKDGGGQNKKLLPSDKNQLASF